MADTLSTIHLMANDTDFNGRLTAAAAQEHAPGDAVMWVWERRYELCSAPSWAAKVDSWLASHPDEIPSNGWANDTSVISDLDITAQVQSLLA